MFANVVNNGVAAHYQQQAGAIPAALGEFELPPRGNRGSLWGSAKKCQTLHDLFLEDPTAFSCEGCQVLPPELRFSINFFSILPADLQYFATAGKDDELSLSVSIPTKERRTKAIFNPFFVSHLSFYKQKDTGLDETALCAKYAALAGKLLAR